MKYTTRVRLTIKHEHVHPHYRNMITTEPGGVMGVHVREGSWERVQGG